MEVIMYQKEIIYLGLYKDGDRLGSAGFLKVEKRDKDSNLSLVVKNVPHSINGKYPVRYHGGSDWKEADGITVQNGGGQWEKKEMDSLGQVRLQIMLPGGYLVEGVSKEAARQAVVMKEGERAERRADRESIMPEPEQSEIGESERDLREQTEYRGKTAAVTVEPSVEPHMFQREPSAAVEAKLMPERSDIAEPKFLQERSAAVESAVTPLVFPHRQETAEPVAPRQERQKVERIAVQKQGGRMGGAVAEQPQKPLMADAFVIEGLKEDKWEQILDTYDNIHPYGDGRVYVKLEPKDFIILSGKYQHLVNNSFLLHGFYNYRHVILGKEGEAYYLGVPGVFYEREKMVALMFGFEAFECESGESKAGEFGYYLRKVEL